MVKILVKRLGIFGAVVGLFAGGVSFANASSTPNNTVFYACLNIKGGTLTKVNTTGPISCSSPSTPVSWNSSGIQGIQGIQGAVGAKGDTGSRGTGWLVGYGTPSATNAMSGDLYLDSSDGTVWSFNGTSWNKQGSIKGPEGVFRAGCGDAKWVAVGNQLEEIRNNLDNSGCNFGSDTSGTASFVAATLTGAKFPRVSYNQTNFGFANLTNVTIGAESSLGSYPNFDGALLSGAIVNTALDRPSFVGATGNNVTIGPFTGSVISNATLTNSKFSATLSYSASFSNSNLSGSSFSGGASIDARYGLGLRDNDLSGTTWSGTFAYYPGYVDGYLRHRTVDLTNSNLAGSRWNLDFLFTTGSGQQSFQKPASNTISVLIPGPPSWNSSYHSLDLFTFANTTCPDGSNSDRVGGTCFGHGM